MSAIPDEVQPAGPPPAAPWFVVGLGASAGGITALNGFFASVTPDAGAAYVVVLHLSPDYESQLAQVLQRATSLPVTQVRQQMPVEPNRIYVIPPNANLELKNHQLVVSSLNDLERRAPVDVMFRSLATDYGSLAASVVLSGTGPNGSSGLKQVKELGGLTLVQDPAEAEHAEMPRNAIATGLVDLVLPARQMAPAIVDYFRRLRGRDPEEQRPVADEERQVGAVAEILRHLRLRTGHDFSSYKVATVLRRIERRCLLRGVRSIREYAALMRDDPDEAMPLMKDLLISVTSFFRDAEAFAALEQRVMPAIFAGKQKREHVRVWVAGCATGDEAYSVAILLSEAASRLPEPPSVQIFATDLDRHAIAVAREGTYTASDLANVSEARVARFFERTANGYRVQRWLRELVLFAEHNLLRDPPFSHLDLITCRNLLIYLNRSAQERVLETFHFALRPGRYLFLGASEAPAEDGGLFVPFHKEARIFEGRALTGRLALPLSHATAAEVPHAPALPLDIRPRERMSAGELHHRLLEQYAPPSLIVTEDFLVLHVSDRAGRYLEVGAGEPSREVFKLLKPKLRLELRAALQEAARTRAPVEVSGLRWPGENGEVQLRVMVRPVLREGQPTRGFFLVIFEEGPPAVETALSVSPPTGGASQRLTEELERVKGQLRSTVEQYETQVEEAKASNEELQAVNEELRSAAEELETSKEELQSVNEELTTVNQELKIKIEELGLSNNDLQNFINATDVATIFLDRDLRVKLSTQRARELFHLLSSDTGRRLSDFTSVLKYDGLHDDVARVLKRLETIEREVETRAGLAYLMRMLPYRTVDDRIDGVVLTFLDVTRRRRAEQEVRAGEARMRALMASAVDYAIFTMTDDGIVDMWNVGAERMFGYAADDIVGHDVAVLFTPEDREAGVPAREREQARAHGRASDERTHVRRDGTRFYASGVVSWLGEDDNGPRSGFVKIARDLTAKREADVALEHAHASLEERVQQRTRELQQEVERRRSAQEQAITLLRRLVTAQEDERARVARDLHDELGQQLTALGLTLERARESVSTHDGSTVEIDQALTLFNAINTEVDFLAWELRPAALDDLGLMAALPRYLKAWADHNDIAAEFTASRFSKGQLSPEAEVTFYRIAQETLNNIAKHAHASRVDVILEAHDGQAVLLIEDDGIGFEPGDRDALSKGLGLIGMSERAALTGATLQIESAPGKGTTVYLRQPTVLDTEPRA